MLHGPGPGGRASTTTVFGSKLVLFGGGIGGKTSNDMWALDLYSRMFTYRCYEAFSG